MDPSCVGRRFTRFSAAGLNWLGLIRLFTNGARSVTSRPPLHWAEANVVKSPASICAFGTKAMNDAGRCRRMRALVGGEEEQLVRDDRAAERPAELVALETIVFPLSVGTDARKRARRVETMVAEELERVAGEPIRPRLGHGVDRRRRVEAILGGQAARGHPEFLERIGERQRQVHVLLRVVVRRAVERVADAGRKSAGDGDPHAAWRSPVRRLRQSAPLRPPSAPGWRGSGRQGATRGCVRSRRPR